jgi:hypothetical protein
MLTAVIVINLTAVCRAVLYVAVSLVYRIRSGATLLVSCSWYGKFVLVLN